LNYEKALTKITRIGDLEFIVSNRHGLAYGNPDPPP